MVESSGQTVFENHIASPVVAVAGLSHRPDIDHQLSLAERVFEVDLFGREKLKILGEDSRNMSMTLKTITPDKLEEPFHLAMVVDVFGKNVFAQRVARRAVNEKVRPDTVGAGQFTEKFPAALIVVSIRRATRAVPASRKWPVPRRC